MIRLATCFWLVIAASLGGALYQVKNQVQTLESELVTLNRTILKDQEAIHVLHAEWSYLNQPQRLDELSQRHLELSPINVAQIITMDDLPIRLIESSLEPSAPVDDLDAMTSPVVSQSNSPAAPLTQTKNAGVRPVALTLAGEAP